MVVNAQESTVLSEFDMALINCLQVDPRATWRRVGDALGMDPVTAARRWQRLSDSGAAWVTGRPTGHQSPEACLAVVEVNCATARTSETAQLLARWPHVLSIEHTSGDHDLQILVAVADLASLSRFLLDELGAVPGIRSTRTHVVTKAHTQGDQWQLKMLDATQIARLTAENRPRPARTTRRLLDSADRNLVLCLGENGRMSLADLGRRTGLSLTTVRRRLDDLIAREIVTLRCDASQSMSGWPIALWLWCRIDPDDTETTTALVRGMAGLRVCMSTSGGDANLLLGIAARSMHEAPSVDSRLAGVAPRLRVLNQVMVLRFIKRMGRILDPAGRSAHIVPMDIWSDPIRA
ncbi:AsnC family transcriptional regulator [Saccharopolyspora sp. WRP15-2]|uniref:AsnC family transcriptional regulator n=1 Tax=Saccharopolyspora oryzae TaxID=2997343 RepID=A0ABT4UQL8_9PSEU|nr:AsnC family transcriptional regulator [Saccharopolyspora oryzae]MDA3624015.1 AsnC family transcriptional regulator [Saccharopolyspora oryzae]